MKLFKRIFVGKLYLLASTLLMVYQLEAQTIKYSDFLPGTVNNFNFFIVGKVGHKVQVWKAPKEIHGENNAAATIYVFSDDMKLLNEKTIKLDENYHLPVSITFRQMGDVYDASVNYINGTEIVTRDLWRIGEDGNSLDYTSGTVNETPDSKNPENFLPSQSIIYDHGKYSIVVFTTKDQTIAGIDSLHKSDNLLLVQKNYNDTLKEDKQMQFKSIVSGFDRPGIIKDENGALWIFAIKKQDSSDISLAHVPDKLSLFVAKLDSNLKVVSTTAKFLDIKQSDFNAKINYWVQKVFTKSNALHLVCLGAKPFVYSGSYGEQLVTMIPPISNNVSGYPIESLDIVEIDDSIKSKIDLSLTKNLHNPKLLLGDSFYSQFGKETDLFILQKSQNNMPGIKLFHIIDGSLKETDIQVDPHYKYSVHDTYRLDQHHFLIPFLKKGKVAFMMWGNESL